jgi:hypothetical protein
VDDITVIVPTSYIPSHPSFEIIDQTVQSARAQLPSAPIIVTCDGGVAPEHAGAYDRYCELIEHRWENAMVIRYREHEHQSGMLPVSLAMTLTPFLLYLEHDWQLLEPIEWEGIKRALGGGMFNYVKFHAGPRVHPAHEHLMEARVVLDEVPFIHTRQWSQNPHLARTEFYRNQVLPYCEGKTDFIEDILHGMVGSSPWQDWKCAVYNPVKGDMQRVRHLDGRGSKACGS